ncbi:hypothetical protein CSV79_09815 [Sporosarcina sp. P13]|uniref:VanW family protein n=1 Tax=Sporosarcina sp. P13 TaxID=2048263 RepID=UPI000C163D2B|nr:VanW family protein [Sporosarcina sp. P13]PIC63847.1 hypothetical protein CSV79_09815 [Sporosarcina sp. P13]
MKNKLYKISLSLGALLLVISTIFAQQAYAGDGFFSNIKRFDKHTYAGPFNISKLNRKKAKQKLTTDFVELEQNLAVKLIVQDLYVDVPSEAVTFDVDATVDQASSGQENALIATVSRDGLRTVLTQNFSSLVFTEDEVDTLASQIESQLRSGIMPQHIYLAKSIPELYEQAQTIASATYATKQLTKGLRLLLDDLNGAEIQPNSTFSFQEFVKDRESVVASDQDMSIMASLLYETALQTNWIIDERSIGNELTEGVQPGFEAVVNRKLDLDLQVTNPNQTVFTLHTKWDNSQITLSIEGLPFMHTYLPEVENLKLYNPKTVVQYSAFIPSGRVQTINKGKKAMEATVKRSILLNGSLLDYEDISIDFYTPQSKVERRNLTRPKTLTAGSADGTNSGSDLNPDSSSPTAGGNSSTDGSANGSDSGKPGSSSSNGSSNGNTSDKSGISGGNDSGNPNASGGQNKDEVFYDKGGNRVDKNGDPLD